MIKCIEFTEELNYKYINNQMEIDKDESKSALDQLNEYLQQNEQEIDLIQIQKHVDSYLLIYRVVEIVNECPHNLKVGDTFELANWLCEITSITEKPLGKGDKYTFKVK
jgi:translation elongation factor P/translation initiation factor 5A